MSVEWDDIRSSKDSFKKLGSGGFGTVYKTSVIDIPGEARTLAVKIYKPKAGVINEGSFQSLINVREKLKRDEQKRCEKLDSLFTWPLALVTSDGRAKGIVMNLIPDKYFGKSNLPMIKGQTVERNLGHVIDDGELSGWGPLNTDKKLEILFQIAYALAFLHKLGDESAGTGNGTRGIVYGDISPNNILYSLDGGTEIMFVDCDSVRKVGAQAPTGRQAHTPDWEPPEAKRAKRKLSRLDKSSSDYQLLQGRYNNEWSRQTLQTDVYKFGLAFLRVIDSGRQASTKTDPSDAKRKVAVSLSALLDASLSENPKDRPTMKDWVLAFKGNGINSSSTRSQSSPKVSANYVNKRGDFVQLPSGVWVRQSSFH